MKHAQQFLHEAADICRVIDPQEIEGMAQALAWVAGRVYLIGLGGSLANCMHMAADLRKLCEIDAVGPDNMAELTAWANDEGWDHLFDGYLALMTDMDALFVLSVGGGYHDVSRPLANAVKYALSIDAQVFGIVGPNGGYTAEHGHHVIRIPVPQENAGHVTPHTEAFHAVIWHCLVSHPLLQKRKTKW